MCVCVCVRACVRARVRACVRVCVCVCGGGGGVGVLLCRNFTDVGEYSGQVAQPCSRRVSWEEVSLQVSSLDCHVSKHSLKAVTKLVIVSVVISVLITVMMLPPFVHISSNDGEQK